MDRRKPTLKTELILHKDIDNNYIQFQTATERAFDWLVKEAGQYSFEFYIYSLNINEVCKKGNIYINECYDFDEVFDYLSKPVFENTQLNVLNFEGLKNDKS